MVRADEAVRLRARSLTGFEYVFGLDEAPTCRDAYTHVLDVTRAREGGAPPYDIDLVTMGVRVPHDSDADLVAWMHSVNVDPSVRDIYLSDTDVPVVIRVYVLFRVQAIDGQVVPL